MKPYVPMLVLSLAVPLAPAASAAEEPAVKPTLSGRWTLDPEKSEDGRAKMRDAWQARGGGARGEPVSVRRVYRREPPPR